MLVRLSISCFLGVFGGLAALFVLRIGLFLTGCCFGLVACMLAMLTPLGAPGAADQRGFYRAALNSWISTVGVAACSRKSGHV